VKKIIFVFGDDLLQFDGSEDPISGTYYSQQ